LALLSIEESGSAEHTGGYRSYRRGGYDDEDDDDGDNDEFEVTEVVHRCETVSDWRRPDGGDPGLGILPFDEAELSPPDALEDMAPERRKWPEKAGTCQYSRFRVSSPRRTTMNGPGRSRFD
jgi:hypothetical protein